MNFASLTANKIYFRWLSYLLIFTGIVLRLKLFLENRALFIDEACLSYQIIDRGYGGLFERMDYQYAPPFFSALVKLMTQGFGATEYALRSIPLLSGIIGLYLFYRLCCQFLKIENVLYPLALYCLGFWFIQYSTEVKQYATDALITMGLLLAALQQDNALFSRRRAAGWAAVGAVVVWLSMPSVFILSGVGLYFGGQLWRSGAWASLWRLGGAIGFWLISFGIYYFTLLRSDIDTDLLQSYHAPFFLPFPPSSLAEWQMTGNILLGLFRTAIGSTVIAILLGILSLGVAFYFLVKKRPELLWLFGIPMLFCLLASGLRLYSLIPRLTLFLMPILLLLVGMGIQEMLERAPRFFKFILIIMMVLTVGNQKGLRYFNQTFVIEESRSVFQFLQQNRQTSEKAYLHFQGTHATTFYQNFYKNKTQLQSGPIHIGVIEDQPTAIVKQYAGQKVWLIFSHSSPEEKNHFYQPFLQKGKVLERYETTGAAAYLFQLNASSSDSGE